MKRLLIADDVPDNLGFLRIYFELIGIQVDFAECGQRALELWRKSREKGTPYDFIVLDVSMPDISGNVVAKAIRDAGDHEARLVFLTGNDRTLNRHAAKDANAAAYLVKPMDAATLHAELMKLEQS
jgi:CheY-like chemotaxis protein